MSNIYLFSEDTGEYSCTMPYTEGETVPENGTLIEPPVLGEHQVNIFENGAWVTKEDYRFKYYKKDSEGNVTPITEIGEIEEEYTIVSKEEGDFETAKVEKQKENKEKCSAALDKGLVQIEGWEVHSFSTDSKELASLNLIYAKMQDDSTYTADWHSHIDYGVMLDKETTAKLLTSIETYRAYQWSRRAYYTNLINAATTIEELEEIEINYEEE